MKKYIIIVILVVSFLLPVNLAASPITINIDGVQLKTDTNPITENGRTLVAVRHIFEEFGLKVDWQARDRIVTASNEDTNIRLQVDNKTAYVNGRIIELDVPPRVVNDRTLVPLRFVAENLDSKVVWNEETKVIDINRISHEYPIESDYIYALSMEDIDQSISIINKGMENSLDYLNKNYLLKVEDSKVQDLYSVSLGSNFSDILYNFSGVDSLSQKKNQLIKLNNRKVQRENINFYIIFEGEKPLDKSEYKIYLSQGEKNINPVKLTSDRIKTTKDNKNFYRLVIIAEFDHIISRENLSINEDVNLSIKDLAGKENTYKFKLKDYK